MSKLLLDEQPLQVLPCLATAIGLNEAIAIQQLHWVAQNPAMGKVENGRKWIRMTYADWRKGHFPFWSEPTIQRTFDSLEKSDLVHSRDNLNKLHFDRTKWYSINHAKLDEIEKEMDDNPRIVEHIKMKDAHIKMKNASHQVETTIPDTSSTDISGRETTPSAEQTNTPSPSDKAKQSISKALGEYEQQRGRKRGISDPIAAMSDGERHWASRIASVIVQDSIPPETLTTVFPRAFVKDCLWQARDVLRDVASGRYPLERIEEAFDHLMNGGGEKYVNNPNAKAYMVTQEVANYLVNGQRKTGSSSFPTLDEYLATKDQA